MQAWESDSNSKEVPKIRIADLNVNNALSQYLIFEFQKNVNATDVNEEIQVSGNLKDWSNATADFILISSEDNGNGTTKIIYRSVKKFTESNESAFYRLNISNQ